MDRLYCHTKYVYEYKGEGYYSKYNYKATFEEGNWYTILSNKELYKWFLDNTLDNNNDKWCKVLDKNNTIVSFWKNIEDIPDKDTTGLFNNVFYTEDEYRNKQLDKILTI